MKRTNPKAKRTQQLKTKLEFVRTTVSVLTPTELEQVNGHGPGWTVWWCGWGGCGGEPPFTDG